MNGFRVHAVAAALFLLWLGSLTQGCSDRSSSGFSPLGSTSAAVTSPIAVSSGGSSPVGSGSPAVTSPVASSTSTVAGSTSALVTVQPTSAVPAFDPALTLTIVAGGIDSNGPSSTGQYGVVGTGSVLRQVAARMGVPTGDVAPNAPNQFSEFVFYGTQPPPYYSASDTAEVDRQQRGTPRYALIIAKGIRHLMARTGARHVNLVGASLGGMTSRYIIEKDLEGLCSSGVIVRWLTIESTAGGAYLAQLLTRNQLTLPILSLLFRQPIDPTDLLTVSYDFAEREFNTPDSHRSTCPFLANIIVGHQISSDFEFNNRYATYLSGVKPNDGLLLTQDQRLHQIDARPLRGPATVVHDTNHDSVRHDEGAHAALANFLRSRRRVTVRLLLAQVRTLPEQALHGDGEVAFVANIRSPEAQREWGVTDEIATVNDINGMSPLHSFGVNQTKALNEVVFDWFVAPGEQRLELRLSAFEIDHSMWYGVLEDQQNPRQLMDEATVDLPVSAVGSRTVVVDTPSFRAEVGVEVFLE